jgi:GH25 family lysozyme M1 (1,4-beta-N-acetylmuramidase)
VCHDAPYAGGDVVSDADKELKRVLECLRLASDFIQLSRDTLDPVLQEHYVRMASYWSDQADGNPSEEPHQPG